MGNPVLRRTAEKILGNEIKSERIQRLIADMFDTMAEYGGVGLAAPQVHESVQLLVIEDIPDPDNEGQFLARRRAVINPRSPSSATRKSPISRVVSRSRFPGRVPRIRKIRVRGLDHNGEKIDDEIEGFPPSFTSTRSIT